MFETNYESCTLKSSFVRSAPASYTVPSRLEHDTAFVLCSFEGFYLLQGFAERCLCSRPCQSRHAVALPIFQVWARWHSELRKNMFAAWKTGESTMMVGKKSSPRIWLHEIWRPFAWPCRCRSYEDCWHTSALFSVDRRAKSITAWFWFPLKVLRAFTRWTCCRRGEFSFQWSILYPMRQNHVWQVQQRFRFLDSHFLHEHPPRSARFPLSGSAGPTFDEGSTTDTNLEDHHEWSWTNSICCKIRPARVISCQTSMGSHGFKRIYLASIAPAELQQFKFEPFTPNPNAFHVTL